MKRTASQPSQVFCPLPPAYALAGYTSKFRFPSLFLSHLLNFLTQDLSSFNVNSLGSSYEVLEILTPRVNCFC